MVQFYHAIIDEKAYSEMLREIPLDMSQYPNFFRSVRIPTHQRDGHCVAEFSKVDNHISFLTNGNIYTIPVTDEEGLMYSSEALSKVIEEIFSLNEPAGPNVRIFTTTSRNKAADIYQRLAVTQVNTECLHSIADLLVVISIDEDSTNSNEAIHNLLLSGKNKYFDKTLQIVMTKAGELGYSVEHTAVDGTTSFAVIQYVQDQLISTNLENIETNVQPTAEKLDWMLSAELQQELHALEKENGKIVQNILFMW